jgi:hypothetical protein
VSTARFLIGDLLAGEVGAHLCQTCGVRIETHPVTCEPFGYIPPPDADLRDRLADIADYVAGPA